MKLCFLLTVRCKIAAIVLDMVLKMVAKQKGFIKKIVWLYIRIQNGCKTKRLIQRKLQQFAINIDKIDMLKTTNRNY